MSLEKQYQEIPPPKWPRLLAAWVLILLAITPAVPDVKNSKSPDVLLAQPLTVRWRYESNGTLNLTPASDGERVYLPLAGGTIVALKAKDGQLFWKSDMGGELSASPVADENAIYVASETVVQANEPQKPAGALRALGR